MMALSRRSARWLLAGAVLIVASIAGARLIDSPAPWVAVARVRVGALESWISTNGVIEPSEPHVIRAPVATFLKTVDVVEGQTVKRGVTLMTLDLAEQRAELARARQELATAQNELHVLQAGGSATDLAQVERDVRNADAEVGEVG